MNCSYCDSRYACEKDSFDYMSIPEILNAVANYKCKAVTVTGGEPLIHPGIDTLLFMLNDAGYKVNVETNGSQILRIPLLEMSNVFFTIDYKSLSSDMNDKMERSSFYRLRDQDVLKCVVENEADMDDFLCFVEEIDPRAQIYLSPVFGKIEPAAIVSYIQRHELFDWKVQIQLHKVIWNPDMRGV